MNLRAVFMNLLRRVRQDPGQPRIYVSHRQAGVVVDEDTALTYSAVWACVRVISESIAALPWHVYRSANGDTQRADGAIAWLLGTQPNPEMTAFAWRETILAHALTWGNGYSEIVRDMAGRPAELQLLTPDRVTPKRDDAGRLFYRYCADDGTERDIDPRNIFHLHGLGWDGLVGYSPVRLAARSIGLGIAQDAFGQAFYANGTVFGGMVEIPGTMKKEDIRATEEYLNERHRGPDNAFRIKVAPLGSKYSNAGMPMTDAQFLESRRFSVNDVARWYRVPPHKIGDLERSTNNNIEHQAIEFVTDTLMPWIKRLEDEANVKLFGARAQGAMYSKISASAMMRGDSKTRAEFYRTMTQIGVMTINEVRALEELNSLGDIGDTPLVQTNQTTLERLVKEPEPKLAEPVAPDQPADTSATDPQHSDAMSPGNVIRREALSYWRQHQQQQQGAAAS